MNSAANMLAELAREWTPAGRVPEVDWARMRSLEFQDAVRSKETLAKRLDAYACVHDDDFDAKVGIDFCFAKRPI